MAKHDKSKQPKVAIVTRTKNRTFMLERALQSVENQTYDDYVHVILNDGGDKAPVEELVRKYKNDRRVVLHNDQSVGITRALNQAIRAVDSKYIAILDDDDVWAAERLEGSVKHLDATDMNAVVVKMDIVEEEIEGTEVKRVAQYLHPQSGEGEISLFKQCRRNYLSNGVVMYTRSIYDALGGYDETLPTAEDWDFGIRLMLKGDVDFIGEGESLVFYHQRPKAMGDKGNSGLAGVRLQEKTINKLRNKYLRDDLGRGSLGVGYLMNSQEQDNDNIVRLEGHINYTADQLRRHTEDLSRRHIKKPLVKRVKNKIASLSGK